MTPVNENGNCEKYINKHVSSKSLTFQETVGGQDSLNQAIENQFQIQNFGAVFHTKHNTMNSSKENKTNSIKMI